MSFYIVICQMAKLEIALHTVRLSISELNVFDKDFLFFLHVFHFSVQSFKELSSCNDLHRLFVVVLPLS